MKNTSLLLLSLVALLISCNSKTEQKTENPTTNVVNPKVRKQIDTIGFAQEKWQMDSIFKRISLNDKASNETTYKAVICPHDDYSYAAGLYSKTLSGVKAKTIVLIGVAHRAKNFDLKDKLIFGSYDSWNAPDGNIKVSALRNKILSKMPENTFVLHDSMMQLEHSLEAITPFLQRQNAETEIIPILVPYMRFSTMQDIAKPLGQALHEILFENKLIYGSDLAIVISSDAIHYGDEDWGGSDMAPFGTDQEGTARVKAKEMTIANELLSDTLTTEDVMQFNKITVKEEDYTQYKWTWCGRYSVPFGLVLANNLNYLEGEKPLVGTFIDYRSSLDLPHIKVDDLQMGTTAPANAHHWVGYLGMGYK
ncbi:MAG: AmmeMemoRadiSam system protein B [Leeuwenhoekiella sp.]